MKALLQVHVIHWWDNSSSTIRQNSCNCLSTYISLVFCFSITTNFSRPSLPLEDSSTNNASDDAQDDEKNFTAWPVSNNKSTYFVLSYTFGVSFSFPDLNDSRENETHEISLREPLSSNASTSRESSVCWKVSVSKNALKRTRKRLHELDDVETAIFSKLSRNEECDSEEHFGLHVASILRTLPPRQCTLPYSGKYWREQKLANLTKGRSFTKF